MIGWFFSFTGNSHNLFYTSAQEEMTLRDLNDLKSKLEILRQSGESKFDNEVRVLTSQVNIRKDALEMQIINEKNPGIGVKSRKVIHELDIILDTKLTLLDDDNFEILATKMGNQVSDAREIRVGKINADKEDFLDYLKLEDHEQVLADIEDSYEYTKLAENRDFVDRTLMRGTMLYNKSLEYFDEMDVGDEKLPRPTK